VIAVEQTAGGVVYREREGQIELLLIHDRFGHISLPKGHLEGEETVEEAALREIEEETGIRGRIIGEPLGVITYEYRTGDRTGCKQVTYFLVEAVGGETVAQAEEIRDVEWFPLDAACEIHKKRGYENNHSILEEAIQRLKGRIA
jgi:8-oxo-dGTP pyrophosphatase MutT (NUDIX family)